MSSVTCKVLIVDDALFMRQVLKDILRSNGIDCEILEASDGVEGVKAFQQHKPDLVIMDINMPRADGIQALKAIMKINPNAKVVMVTTIEQKNIVQEAIRLGARDYVVKPFDSAQVPLVLGKILRQK